MNNTEPEKARKSKSAKRNQPLLKSVARVVGIAVGAVSSALEPKLGQTGTKEETKNGMLGTDKPVKKSRTRRRSTTKKKTRNKRKS